MSEKTVKTVIESLVETIENLETKVWMLEYEKEKLKEELKSVKELKNETV
jgi:chaperonin cofactor prefoldin